MNWIPVWFRNFEVWRKLFIPFLVGNFGDPLIYLLALGYGLGRFVSTMGGMPYLVFLASGIVCSSAMNAATFEGLFSAYTRMVQQKTWKGILATPIGIADIVLGETLWAATKGLISAVAILLVAAFKSKLIAGWQAVWTIPIIFLVSASFASMALVVTALAKGFDFFTYYFTLIITPIMLLSDVFFPISGMPPFIQWLAKLLPLYHAVAVVRPLMTGGSIAALSLLLHILVLLFYAIVPYFLAVFLVKRRLID